MNGELFAALVISLLLTLIFEVGFFLLTGKRNKRDLLLVCLVNVLTNPVVVLFYWLAVLYTSLNSVIVKVLLEFCAVAVEAHYYKNYGEEFRRPFAFSVAANAVSFGIGLFIQLLI